MLYAVASMCLCHMLQLLFLTYLNENALYVLKVPFYLIFFCISRTCKMKYKGEIIDNLIVEVFYSL